MTGRTAEARTAARRAVEVLESVPPGRELAMAYSNVSQLHMLANEEAEAIRWGDRALALAGAGGDVETQTHALVNVGSARLQRGEARGVAELARAHDLAATAGLDDHAARALVNLATSYTDRWDLEPATDALEQALAFTTARNLDGYARHLLGHRARIKLARGEWAAARADAERALDGLDPPGVGLVPALAILGGLRSRLGAPDARPLLDLAANLAAGTGELQYLVPASAALAEHHWLVGERRQAADAVRQGPGQALAAGQPWSVGELGHWLWRAGDPVELPEWTALPYLQLIRGDWAGAAREWQRRGCAYQRVEALSHGDGAAVAEALAGLDRLGASASARRLRTLLRERGVVHAPRGPRASTGANPAGLTARQLEVVGLLTEGLSNAEIARRLSLSAKTVDHHVSAVLGKLGVTTRGRAAAAARELGLVTAADLPAGGRVLDIATGSGNAALAAARCGCVVTGLDYVPELLERGRSRAAAEGLPVEFVQGDAERIGYPDETFDAVLSCVGVMFAPDQERAAAELIRVCRVGGTIALACWTPDGFIGDLFRTVGRHVPPPKDLRAPVEWGNRQRLGELFGATVTGLRATRREFVFRHAAPEEFVDFFRHNYGPPLKAFEALGPRGGEPLHADRAGIWQQIVEERDLRTLIGQMLSSSAISFALYGAVLGASYGWQQIASSLIKLPLLFLATLAICLPTLYLFNLVFGARLSMVQAVALILVSITVTAVLTLAFAPVSLFFLVTAQSYSFYKLLNVAILLLTAVIGLRFLVAGMHALNEQRPVPATLPAPVPTAIPATVPVPANGSAPQPVAPVGVSAATADGTAVATTPATAVAVAPAAAPPAPVATATHQPVHPAPHWLGQPVQPHFGPVRPPAEPRPASISLVYIWIVLFGFVGTQLAWTLRPFFGDPGQPFGVFREVGGTFYADVLRTLGDLLGG